MAVDKWNMVEWAIDRRIFDCGRIVYFTPALRRRAAVCLPGAARSPPGGA